MILYSESRAAAKWLKVCVLKKKEVRCVLCGKSLLKKTKLYFIRVD